MPESDDRLARELRELADGATRSVVGPAPDAVRDRGSRRHQRRVVAVAALTTLAVVAVGSVAVGAARDSAGPDDAPATRHTDGAPGPVPEGGWLTEVPAGFVIDAEPLPVGGANPDFGPDVGERPGREITATMQICDARPLAGEPAPLDALGIVTPVTWRGVQVYADEATATAERDALVAAAGEDCSDGSGTWDVAPVQGVADTVVVQTLPDGDLVWYQLVQQGNALAVVQTTALADARQLGAEALAGLAEQMCVFTAAGCGEGTEGGDGNLTAADLPDAAELPGLNEQSGWRETSTTPGDGQSTASMCQQQTFAGMGADEVWRRDYTMTNDEAPGTQPDPDTDVASTVLVAAQFRDVQKALRTFALLRLWIAACDPEPYEETSVNELGEISADLGEGTAWLLIHTPVEGDPDAGLFDGTAVGVSGDRVVLISQTSVGQDYNYPAGETPIAGALAAALDRLPPG